MRSLTCVIRHVRISKYDLFSSPVTGPVHAPSSVGGTLLVMPGISM